MSRPCLMTLHSEDSAEAESGNEPPGAPAESLKPVRPRNSLAAYRRYRRRQFRTSVLLFLATLFSTFLVGSQFMLLELAPALFSDVHREVVESRILRRSLQTGTPPVTVEQLLYDTTLEGLRYAVPLMFILLCHEMGHFLQSVRYRIPATFPYFIPLPLTPLGTMGAVILQGRGVADRRQMFDIAVSGPIAGLAATLPILYYGILTSRFEAIDPQRMSMEFGEPLLLKWMIRTLHGETLDGTVFVLNGYGFAGWVGVFITAMNLLPVGQLDGGHILFTLIGRPAHTIALLVIATGAALMLYSGTYSYMLLILLLIMTGARHPPTADDTVPLGFPRQLIGWLTLAFLFLGFTPQPIVVQEPRPRPADVDRHRRVDPATVDPRDLVQTDRSDVTGLLPAQFRQNCQSEASADSLSLNSSSRGTWTYSWKTVPQWTAPVRQSRDWP